jgi:putative Mn2+ efflux pump MntP
MNVPGLIALLMLGAALGLDSLRVTVGMGMHGLPARRRWQLASAFGICDGLALFVGASIGGVPLHWLSPTFSVVGPLLLAGYGVYMILTSMLDKEIEPEKRPGWILFGIPVVLGLDNFVAGVALGAIGYPLLISATVVGIISGLMAMIGFALGAMLRRQFPSRIGIFGGALVLVSALLTAVE